MRLDLTQPGGDTAGAGAYCREALDLLDQEDDAVLRGRNYRQFAAWLWRRRSRRRATKW